MAKEELKQKAEEYALEKCKECYMCNSVENEERGYCPKYESRIEGYITGATEETKELEAQIEKMKCCQNCRKFNNLSYDCTCAEVCNEWELRR